VCSDQSFKNRAGLQEPNRRAAFARAIPAREKRPAQQLRMRHIINTDENANSDFPNASQSLPLLPIGN
jgi:hypothetical protein